MRDAAKIKLTEAQRGWLEAIADQPTGMLARMHIGAGEGGGINGLLNKGLIEWRKGEKRFLQATPLGLKVRSILASRAIKKNGGQS